MVARSNRAAQTNLKGETMLDLTKPMQTRDGYPARYVGRSDNAHPDRPLIFEYKKPSGKYGMDLFYPNGKRWDLSMDCELDIINVPEFKLEVNKFYWTENNKIIKIYWHKITEHNNYFLGIFTESGAQWEWRLNGEFYSGRQESLRLTRELTQQELEEYGLVGK